MLLPVVGAGLMGRVRSCLLVERPGWALGAVQVAPADPVDVRPEASQPELVLARP